VINRKTLLSIFILFVVFYLGMVVEYFVHFNNNFMYRHTMKTFYISITAVQFVYLIIEALLLNTKILMWQSDYMMTMEKTMMKKQG
jgi:capsular polysaccharide biosynthesis protein